MRLIDADELVKAIENENPGMSISGTVEKFARTIQVKMQPTIEAIPIEWVIELSNKLKDDEDDFEKAMFLLDLVDLWGKENEID